MWGSVTTFFSIFIYHLVRISVLGYHDVLLKSLVVGYYTVQRQGGIGKRKQEN